jgi:hypothetical protein
VKKQRLAEFCLSSRIIEESENSFSWLVGIESMTEECRERDESGAEEFYRRIMRSIEES